MNNLTIHTVLIIRHIVQGLRTFGSRDYGRLVTVVALCLFSSCPKPPNPHRNKTTIEDKNIMYVILVRVSISVIKLHEQKHSRGGHLFSSHLHITKPSSKEMRAGTEQSPWSKAIYWLAPYYSLSLLSYTTQDYLLRWLHLHAIPTAHLGGGPSHMNR